MRRHAAEASEANVALGISNLILGSILAGWGVWQHAQPEHAPSVVTALLVAGAGAVSVGVYQIWRQLEVYR